MAVNLVCRLYSYQVGDCKRQVVSGTESWFSIMPRQPAKSMHTAWAFSKSEWHHPGCLRPTKIDHGSSHESQAVAGFISTSRPNSLRICHWRTMSRLHLQSYGIHTSAPSVSINFAPQRRRRVISNLRSTNMALKQFDVDVAVVGGGPGGLAAAAAIASAFGTDTTVKVRSKWQSSCMPCTCMSVSSSRPNLALQIYESLKKYTLQGSGVLMMPNVQNALEAIQPSLLQK